MRTGLKITGLAELTRKLRRLKETEAESIVRPALHAAAQPFASAVRGDSPQSRVSIEDVAAPEAGGIVAEVVIRDRATHEQRRAVHGAYQGTRDECQAIARELIEEGIRRELRS